MSKLPELTIPALARELLKVATDPYILPFRFGGIWQVRLGDCARPDVVGNGGDVSLLVAIEQAVADFRARVASRLAQKDHDEPGPLVSDRHAHADLGGES